MIVELRARKRMRPRRAVIIHEWLIHENPIPLNWVPDTETIFEAVTFVQMRWPRGRDVWDMVICRVCNREYLWDQERHGECPPCPHCAQEFDDLLDEEIDDP